MNNKEKQKNYYFYIIPHDKANMMFILRELLDAGVFISGNPDCTEESLNDYDSGTTRFYYISVDLENQQTNGWNTISEAKRNCAGGGWGIEGITAKKIKLEDLLKILPDYGIKRRYNIPKTDKVFPFGH